MPTDDLIPEIDNIINICNDKVGAKPHLTVGRTDYLVNRGLLTDLKKEEYVECWSKFDSAMFNLKMKLLDKKRNEFCYAGDWTLFVNMYTGEASPCYLQPYKQNIFENPNKPINFIAVGKHCLEPYCINGHAHLAMGAIPELDLPTYDEIRNRETYDGTEWLSEETKSFFSHKLSESNNKYSLSKQYINYWGWYWRAFIFVIKHSDKVKRHIKSVMWKKKNKK